MRRLVVVFVSVLFLSFPALAQTPVGTVLVVEGEQALILHGAQPGGAPLTASQPVIVGDMIQTGPGGRALILFLDETRITLGENAQLRVDEYFYDDMQPAGNRVQLNIPRGAFLFVTGKMAAAPTSVMRIITPMGALIPRSTATGWSGMIDQEFAVYTDSGEFSFETNRGRVRVAQGEGSVIRSVSAIPMRPAPWLPEKVTAAKGMIGLSNIEAARTALEQAKATHVSYLPAHRDETRALRTQMVEDLQGRPNQRRIDVGALQGVRDAPEAVIEQQQAAPAVAEQPQPVAATPEPEPSAPAAPEAAPPAPVPEPNAEEKPEIIKGQPAVTPPEAPAFPAPPPSAATVDPDSLPADPAMRQEALEKLALPPSGAPDPFGGGDHQAPDKTHDPF